MKKQHKKLKLHFFKNWRIIIASEGAQNKGTRFYPATLHWYAFPIDSQSSEFRDAVHQGKGGLEKAETKLIEL